MLVVAGPAIARIYDTLWSWTVGMTELSKAEKELAALRESVVRTVDPSRFATFTPNDSEGREEAEKCLAKLEAAGKEYEAGSLGQKLKRLEGRVKVPEGERLVNETTAARINKLLEQADAFSEERASLEGVLRAWVDQAERYSSFMKELTAQLSLLVAEEAGRRPLVVCEEEEERTRSELDLEAIATLLREHMDVRDAACAEEKKALQREKKKARKKEKEQEARKQRQRQAELQHSLLLEALQDVVERHEQVYSRLVREEATERSELLTTRSTARSGRRSPKTSPRRSKTPPMPGSAESTPLRDISDNVFADTFNVEGVAGQPFIKLSSRTSTTSLTIFRCLLRLADVPPGKPFTIPNELLTDRKAKKRLQAAGSKYLEGNSASEEEEEEGVSEGEDSNPDEDLMATGDDGDSLDGDDDEAPTTVSLGFLPPLLKGCHVVMASVGGTFAGGVFINHDCVIHTSFTRYIVRKKQGGRQSATDAGRSIGSQMRRYHEGKFRVQIGDLLKSWSVPIQNAVAIFLYAPGPVNRGPFFSGPAPLDRKDPRLLPVPMVVHKPTFAEVQRIHKTMLSGVYHE